MSHPNNNGYQCGARPKAATKEHPQFAGSITWRLLIRQREPAWPGLTVTQQLFSVTAGRKPGLARFSGDHGIEGYDLWRHQLSSLIKGHTDSEGYDLWRHQLISLIKEGHTDSEGYDLW